MCFLFLFSHQIFYSWACEMEKRRANLFTANSTPAGRPHCLLCVVCGCVHAPLTSVEIIWKQFSPPFLWAFFIYLFIYKYGFFAPLHFWAVFMLSLHYWSVKMKVRVESKKNGRRNQCYFPAFTIGDSEIFFFFFAELYRQAEIHSVSLSAPSHVLE